MTLRSAATAVGVGIVAILIASVIVTSVFAAATDTAVDNQTAAVEVTDGGGQLQILSGSSVSNHHSTTTSLEDQLQTSGSGSVAVSTDANVSEQSWALCTWTSAAQSTANTENRTIVGYENIALWYDGSNAEYVGYYYNDSTREEYSIRVAAPDPTNSSLVCVQRDGSTLMASRNTTTSSVAVSSATTTRGPPGADWNGTIEETRLYDYPLNSSQRGEWVGEPVLAVQGPAPALRLTYDVRGDSGPVRVFFAGGSASLTGDAQLVRGFDGPAVTRGTDYSWDGLDGATLTVDGATLEDDGEVLYHQFSKSQFGGLINRAGQIGASAFALLVVALLLKAATAVAGFVGGDGL